MTIVAYTLINIIDKQLNVIICSSFIVSISTMLKIFTLILILKTVHSYENECPLYSATTVSGTHAPNKQLCSGDLIFEDNFDSLDLKKWQHEQTLGGGGNWEFQWYTNNRSNSYTDNGILYIKPTLLADEYGNDYLYSGTLDINGGSPADECTNPQWYGCSRTGTSTNILNPIKSARIRSLYSFSFKYGKVEVRAKAPRGDWLWPAIWLLPRYNQYSTWPASGEIDMMESRGNRNLTDSDGVNIGTHLVGQTLHWGPNSNTDKYELTHFETFNDSGFDSDYHRYQLLWTPYEIQFMIDDQNVSVVQPPSGGFWELGNLTSTGMDNPWKRDTKMAPFDQEFYLIINLACGGISYFPDSSQKPWSNQSPKAATDFWEGRDEWLSTWELNTTDNAAFKIDYVKVWAL